MCACRQTWLHLLASDERLRQDYRSFTLSCLDSIKQIVKAMEDSEIYLPLDDTQRQSNALNTWLIVTNWMTFLKTVHGDEDSTAVNRDAIKHGIYLILDYLMPYMREEKRDQMRQLQREYCYDNIMPEPETSETPAG